MIEPFKKAMKWHNEICHETGMLNVRKMCNRRILVDPARGHCY